MTSSSAPPIRRQPRFHIILSRGFDLEAMERGAELDLNPRHGMRFLARTLRATVHDPSDHRPNLLDRLLGRVIATPEHWALARSLTATLGPQDVVYATGAEGLAFPLLQRLRAPRPAFAFDLMTPTNRKLRLLFHQRSIARCVDLAVVSNEHKRGLVARLLRLPRERVFVLPEQTDARFFSPGPARSRQRPLLFSAGLEQRDYRVLAQAIDGLDVDCEVCAMSPNARRSSSIFPERLPPNMKLLPMPWPQFRQAYRDAAIVVVPLIHNLYSAGSTVVMEALACKRPVLMTDIPGIGHDLGARKLIKTVPPGDAKALRAAIVHWLQDRADAEAYAERGHAEVLRAHTLEIVIGQLAEQIAGLTAVREPDTGPAIDRAPAYGKARAG